MLPKQRIAIISYSQSTASCSAHARYLPIPIPPCCAIAAFCSWNLSPNRSELFKNLSTHLITHPSSLPCKLFDVKSVMQSLKHRCTRFEYICSIRVSLWFDVDQSA